MPGPTADPTALRRDRNGDRAFVHLPAAGCKEPAPAWPLTAATPRERVIWRRLWAYPQAVEWHRLSLELEVAIHTRSLAEAEKRGASAARLSLVLAQQTSLGLSIVGLGKCRWVIDRDAPALVAMPGASGPSASRRLSARERLAGSAPKGAS